MALSARLDGEDPPVSRERVDAHLLGCADCRGWLEDAARITRMARMSVVTPVPDIGDEVLAVAPRPARLGLARMLRGALAVVGGSQLLLGLVQMTAYLPATHPHVDGAGSYHLWHESAAWNVAIGAGFLWTAMRRVPASALVPVLTAFVALLTLLSANDLWSGTVEPERLLSHGLVVAGYVILMVLTRPALAGAGPPSGPDGGPPRWRVRFDEAV
jgi:predicted anti-sigma-YlaC factor YlaD